MQDIENGANNILLLIIGAFTGLYGLTAQDIDLWIGIFLKLISIFSFFIVIVINLPKFINVIKSLWKR